MSTLVPGAHAAERPSFESRIVGVRDRTVAFWDSVRVLELVLGVLLVFANYPVSANLPGQIVLSAAIVAVGVFCRPRLWVPWGGALLIGALTLYAFLVGVSIYQGTDWVQRIVKFTLLLLLVIVVASGRVHIRSLVVGGCIGALVNVPLFYAGMATNYYPPFLTGFYQDKNVAGMYYALWGVLGLMVMPKKWRIPWVAVSAALLFLTGSRTSIAAFAMALGWYLIRNRVDWVLRLAVSGGAVLVLRFVANQYSQVGLYASRAGDDWFRNQIDLATFAKEAITPWHGLGLNEGYVMLGQRFVWFHDSYAQAFVEGGYPFLWATILAFGLLGVGLLDRRSRVGHELLAAEAAVVVIMVCAWKLGETFMTLAGFLPLGIAIALRLGKPSTAANQWWRTR